MNMTESQNQKIEKKHSRGIFSKVLLGAAAGVAVGMLTYKLTKTEKTPKDITVNEIEDQLKDERLFV